MGMARLAIGYPVTRRCRPRSEKWSKTSDWFVALVFVFSQLDQFSIMFR